MENIEIGCSMIDVSVVANLVEYIEKHRHPCYRRLKDMSEEIRSIMQKQKRMGKGIDKTVYEAKRELNTYKLQLRHVSKDLEDVKTKIKKLANEKDKEIQLLTKEQMRLKSCNTELETRLQTYQDQNIYKLRRELQEKDANLSQLKDRLINVDANHSLNEQEILNSERSLTESKEESYHIKHELCQLKKNNEYLKNEIGRREVKLREHKVERVQMLLKLKYSNKQVRLMQTKNAELQRDSAKYDQIKNDLETQIENMNKKYVTVNERQEKLKTENDKIISEMNQTIIELKRKTSDLKDTEKSLNLEIRDKDNRISILYDEFNKYTKMVKKKEIELEREMENKMQIFKSNLNKDLQNKDSNFYESERAKKDQMLVQINEGKNKMEARVKTLVEEVKAKDTKIDALATELQQRLAHHNKIQKNLEHIISSKEKLVLDLENKIEQWEAKVDSLKIKLEQDSSENVSGREHKIDAAVKNEIRELKKQLQHTLSKLHDTQAELDDTKTRLSKAMGDRLTDNNTNITALSDRNRPTKLAEKCAELYDNQWTDAYEILEKYFSTDEAVIESLLHILQATMDFCRNTAQHKLDERTLQYADKHEHENTDVSNSVHKHFMDTRKAAASSELENLRKMFVLHLRQSADQTVTKALEIKEFTFECLELCWFMVVNDPPVAFAPLLEKGTNFNSDLYKPYTFGGTHVEYVVWPALLLHEGGPILAKGVAQGFNKSKKDK